jgi:hypothetical protein
MAGVFTKSVADKPLQWLGVVAVLGGGAYLLYRKLGKSSAEKLAETSETSESIDNPFSYNKFLSQSIPDNTSLLTWSQANAYAKTIYDSLNTYFNDSEGICVGAFKTIPSKVKVAQVSRNFYALYKRDILEYIKNGNKTFDFGSGGLSESNYNQVLTIVDKKSKF